MPTYQYHCSSCGRDLEIRQSFSDPTMTVCPECQGSLRKVFNAVGVVFKGSGFYKTDSRSGSTASVPATTTASAPKSSDAPAASAPAASTAAPVAAGSGAAGTD